MIGHVVVYAATSGCQYTMELQGHGRHSEGRSMGRRRQGTQTEETGWIKT